MTNKESEPSVHQTPKSWILKKCGLANRQARKSKYRRVSGIFLKILRNARPGNLQGTGLKVMVRRYLSSVGRDAEIHSDLLNSQKADLHDDKS